MSPAKPPSPYGPIATAIGALLFPHAEVVIHDLRSGKVAAIVNALSDRRVGDDSLVDIQPGADGEGPVWGPYEKTGLRGERLKAVSVALPPLGGEVSDHLLCINLDVSRLDAALQMLSAFVTPRQAQPASLFKADWREQIQTRVHEWLQANGAAMESLARGERIALVGHLDALGLFEARGAADHAAVVLGVARTSFYNYLRAARGETAPSQARP